MATRAFAALPSDLWRGRLQRLCGFSAALWAVSVTAGGLQTARPDPGNRDRGVHVLFDLGSTARSPFPSDRFTVGDDAQITGRRVNLPRPVDCSVTPSDCDEIAQLNLLDGFNADPWLSIPLDGDVDLETIKAGIFLISVGDVENPPNSVVDEAGNRLLLGASAGDVIRLNHIVWDPSARTIHARPDTFLDEHTRYALVVTNRVHDASGKPLAPSELFERYLSDGLGAGGSEASWYRQALLTAAWAARRSGIQGAEVVALSEFTTRSLTVRRQKLNADVQTRPLPQVDLGIAPGGSRAVYPFAQIVSMTMNLQTRTNGPLTPTDLSLTGTAAVPGAVGTLAFGRFMAPDYMTHPGEYIPPVATRTGVISWYRSNTIHFALSAPAGVRPLRGWPVIIFGFGNNGNRLRAITELGSIPQSHGFAVISIENPGSGQGSASTLTIRFKDGMTVTISAPGRGIDQNGDGMIETQEGDRPSGTNRLRQSDVADQFSSDVLSLARAIQNGIDLDGDGTSDLDASRMYYLGQSGEVTESVSLCRCRWSGRLRF